MDHVSLPSLTADGAEGLTAIREDPKRAVIAFDFDGTLSPIVDDPEAARAHPGAASALRRLAPLMGSLAIVTGRPAALAVEYGGFEDIDGLVVLGQYGAERWESGRLTAPEPPPGVAEARAKLPRVLEAAGAPEGTWIEDKGRAVAVHTRRTAEPQVALERLRSIVVALAERTGLTVEPGRFVLELRPPGMDKGLALRSFLNERYGVGSGAGMEAGAAGEATEDRGIATSLSAVLFAGDDLGDVAAYEQIEALRAVGVPGVKVYSSADRRNEVAELADRADLIVDGPAGVVRFLEQLADSLC